MKVYYKKTFSSKFEMYRKILKQLQKVNYDNLYIY